MLQTEAANKATFITIHKIVNKNFRRIMRYGINGDNSVERGAAFSAYMDLAYAKPENKNAALNNDFRLRVTIANYSTRCWLSQLIHRITQVIRYVVRLGNTEWNVTKKEFAPVVKNTLQTQLETELSNVFRNQTNSPFNQKIDDEFSAISDADQQNVAINNKVQELATAIVKQINVEKYTDQYMNDLLKINKADKQVFVPGPDKDSFDKKLNFAKSVEANLNLGQAIIQKEAKHVAQELANYAKTTAMDAATILSDLNNFSGNPFLQAALTPTP